ncbi:MAG: S-layer homology domain-containing protein, partial [Veillonellaceae bacterium]|nr:S-layer homology domain-containing protein [Veillonellaceae bacterium]
MLARDGVIEGYGDGTFQGDKLMNRYEMAAIVAKAAEKYGTAELQDKGVINKLEREYAQELKDMDVRLTAVESDVKDLKAKQSSFKMYGDARVRYMWNKSMSGHDNSNTGNVSHFEKRVRLGIYGEPAKNLTVDGRLKYDDKSNQDKGYGTEQNYNDWSKSWNNEESFRLDKMSLNWHNAGTTTSIGRTQISLGQGLLYWENPVDGFYVEHQFGPKTTLCSAMATSRPRAGRTATSGRRSATSKSSQARRRRLRRRSCIRTRTTRSATARRKTITSSISTPSASTRNSSRAGTSSPSMCATTPAACVTRAASGRV